MTVWNPWHGCRKISPGCANCYVYRRDSLYGKDPSIVTKTGDFDLPRRLTRAREYKIPAGETVYACFTSDFFLEEADAWRIEAWRMIRERSDLAFFLITKRIDRFAVNLPADWGEGWENVTLGCTVETQDLAERRLPRFLAAPLRHRRIICEPLLAPLDLSAWLSPAAVEGVLVGGESGPGARPCDYAWVLALREQCRASGVPFHFKQTGANFVKGGRTYRVPRRLQHAQAERAGLDLP